MTLFEKIEKIQYEMGLTMNAFVEKAGFSKGLYYDIKNGKKKELKPLQAKNINDAFPNYSFDWLMEKSETSDLVNEKTATYNKEGLSFSSYDEFLIYIDEHFEEIFKSRMLNNRYKSDVYREAFNLLVEKKLEKSKTP
jgi:hypothetical protein